MVVKIALIVKMLKILKMFRYLHNYNFFESIAGGWMGRSKSSSIV
jgi:hypothetical protein